MHETLLASGTHYDDVSSDSSTMSTFEVNVRDETETSNAWLFRVDVRTGGMIEARSITLRLAWVDYNHWSPEGTARPEDVAHAALRFLLAQQPVLELHDEIDAARIRRMYPDADERIPLLIARP